MFSWALSSLRWSQGSYGIKVKFMDNKAPKGVRKGYLTTALLFALVGGFFFVNLAIVEVAHATEILYSQTDKTSSKDIGSWGYFYVQKFGNGLTGELSQVCINAYNAQGNFHVEIYSNSNNTNWYGASTIINQNLSVPTSYGADTCFDVSTTFDPDLYYTMKLTYGNYGETAYFRTSTNSNSWSDSTDDLFYNPCGFFGDCGPVSQDRDIYFTMSGTAPPSDTLAISYPGNEATTTDFANFQMPFLSPDTYGYPLPTSDALIFKVFYGTSQSEVALGSASTSTWPNIHHNTAWGPNLLPSIGGTKNVYKTMALSPGTYYAMGELLRASDLQLLATSPEISFNVEAGIYNSDNPTNNATSTWPAETATSTPSTNCSDVAWYWYPFCYFFSPAQDSLDAWKSLGPAIENKPPIGYFTIIKTQIDAITTSTPAFSLPIIGEFKTYFLDPFKTAVSVLLYIGLAIYLFKRFKDFEL